MLTYLSKIYYLRVVFFVRF